MAFGGTAAKLEVLLTARDEVTKKLMGLTKAVEQSAARMKQVGLGMMAIGTAGVAAMTLSLRSVINYNEELLRLSKITGLSIEETQKWRFAITQQEGDFEALTTVFLKLNSIRAKAIEGDKAAVKAFQDLGISVIDAGGKIKSTSEILLSMSNIMKTGKATEEDLANAMELIGIRGGKNLLPFLRTGREGIIALMNEAERLGLISTEQSRAIDKLGDRISALTLPAMKLKAVFATAIAPALERIADLAEKVMNVFSNLSPKMQATIVTVLALGSALLIAAGAGLVFKGFLMGLAVFKWAVIASAFSTFALKLMYMVDGLKAFSLAAVRAIGWAAAIYAVIEAEVRVINAGTAGIFKLMEAYERLRGRGKGPAAEDYRAQAEKYWGMAISPRSQAWDVIFKPMVDTFVNAISSMAEAAKLPGLNLQKSLEDAGDEAEKQFGAAGTFGKGAFGVGEFMPALIGAAGTFGKGAFGVGEFMPALMGVSGNLMGTVRPGVNVYHFTVYADDRRWAEAAQAEFNKHIH